MKNAASLSEPTLVPPGGGASVHGVSDLIKIIRLITSGSSLGGGGGFRGGGGLISESGEVLSPIRVSSPKSSVYIARVLEREHGHISGTNDDPDNNLCGEGRKTGTSNFDPKTRPCA